MNITPAFDYVQARIQARYAERPGASDWASMEQTGNFGRYLQQAAAAGMGRWVEKLGANSNTHEIEVSIREAFRSYMQEVQTWVPASWRAAVLWFGVLVDLESLRSVADGDDIPDWIRNDAVAESELADDHSLKNWREAWRDRWPEVTQVEKRDLEVLANLLPVAGYEDVPMDLVDRTFRRCARRPAGLFSGLTLTLADVLRLRGGLVRRKAFDGGNI